MAGRKQFPLIGVMAGLAIVIILLGAYAGGYLLLGKYDDADPFGGTATRAFPQQWLASAYTPAGWVEGKIRGFEVWVIAIRHAPDDPFSDDPFD